MANRKVVPEERACPVCSQPFLVGGTGNAPKRQVFCSRSCHMRAETPRITGSHAPRPKKNRDTLHDEAWLRARYLDERMSMGDIAASLGCSKQSVVWAMKKFSIERRNASESKVGRSSTRVVTPEMSAQWSESQKVAWGSRSRVSPRRGPNFDPDPAVRAVNTMRAYRRGVDAPLYRGMLAAQNGVCAICGESESKRHRSGTLFTLAVDHDHATGSVRALLCNRCNVVIGFVKEDGDLLARIADYIKAHKA